MTFQEKGVYQLCLTLCSLLFYPMAFMQLKFCFEITMHHPAEKELTAFLFVWHSKWLNAINMLQARERNKVYNGYSLIFKGNISKWKIYCCFKYCTVFCFHWPGKFSSPFTHSLYQSTKVLLQMHLSSSLVMILKHLCLRKLILWCSHRKEAFCHKPALNFTM